MWERARMWEDLPKRIKGKGWVYSMSAWLNGPPDVHDFTLGRQVYETDKLTESQMAAIRSAMRSLARKCSGFELYADRWGMVMRSLLMRPTLIPKVLELREHSTAAMKSVAELLPGLLGLPTA